MSPILFMKLRKKPSEPIVFKGRKTMPSVGIDSPDFVYQDSVHTDLKETFRKARAAIKR